MTMTAKGMVADTKKDAPFWVRNYDLPPEEAPPIKMEVGCCCVSGLLRMMRPPDVTWV